MLTCLANSGIENAIVINKDESLPEKTAAILRKKRRTSKRDGKAETLYQMPLTPGDRFTQVQELLRSPSSATAAPLIL
jgi:hypothetical protein